MLLRCVFETILTLFEWSSQPLDQFFCNRFTLDKLLIILETFSDEFRVLSAEVFSYFFKGRGTDMVKLFKELGGSEKLIAQLMSSTESAQ